MHGKMSSAFCCNLDQSKKLPSGKEINDTTLAFFNLKALVDAKLDVTQNI